MKKLISLIVASCLSFPSLAVSTDNIYLAFGTGLAFLEEFDIPRIPQRYIVRAEPEKGALVLNVCGGYNVLENLRLEGEINYRSSKIDNAEATIFDPLVGTRFVGADGKVNSLSFMVNIWYELNKGRRLVPYLGGGFGAVKSSLEEFYIITEPIVPNPPQIRTLLVDDTDWKFGIQGGAGVGYELGKAFIIDLYYRYFISRNPEFTTVMGHKFKGKNRSHNFQLAIRYFF